MTQNPTRRRRFDLRSVLVTGAIWLTFTGVAASATLNDVRTRDRLICGVSEGLPGFSYRDAVGAWRGFDVDFCRAVAAAALGDAGKVDYVPLSATDRFEALQEGRVDLLSRNSTWTMSRDLGLGIDFAGIAFYDGQGFLANAVDGMTSALELLGARICVVSGTTTENNAADYFASKGMEVFFVQYSKRAAARDAYASGQCDVFTADRSALAAERSLLANPDDHVILPEVISKEPLGPVTREGDAAWTGLVRWTLYGLINAEERGLTAAEFAPAAGFALAAAKDIRSEAIKLGKPASQSLDLPEDWLAVVIGSVGNYREIFDRNLGEDTPLAIDRGVNALWTEGGILYAPPMH